jgi:hypothetical protein
MTTSTVDHEIEDAVEERSSLVREPKNDVSKQPVPKRPLSTQSVRSRWAEIFEGHEEFLGFTPD